MARRGRDRKAEELAKSRTLNPHPEAVVDAQFASSEFFDPADLVQVKYEMVRRVDRPRIFRTTLNKVIHAAVLRFRYSLWTSCGVRYPSPEWRRLVLYRNSMYRARSFRACSRVEYWVRCTRSFFKAAKKDSAMALS
jgi:hypothetical protein